MSDHKIIKHFLIFIHSFGQVQTDCCELGMHKRSSSEPARRTQANEMPDYNEWDGRAVFPHSACRARLWSAASNRLMVNFRKANENHLMFNI